jgi:hypothetical protein
MSSEAFEDVRAAVCGDRSDMLEALASKNALDDGGRLDACPGDFQGQNGNVGDIVDVEAVHLDVTTSLHGISSDIKCPVCLDSLSTAYNLPCNHGYCRDCLRQYFASKIMYAETEIRCFAPLKSDSTLVLNSDVTPQCNQIIPDEVIHSILSDDARLSQKYERFSFFNANADGRECPRCEHRQIGSVLQPSMVCDKCGEVYCFFHGLAHSADETCAQYEAKNAHETELNAKVLQISSKPCPKCGVHISKIGGCNHMKVLLCLAIEFHVNLGLSNALQFQFICDYFSALSARRHFVGFVVAPLKTMCSPHTSSGGTRVDAATCRWVAVTCLVCFID